MSRNLPLPQKTSQLWDQLRSACENPGLHFARYLDRWKDDFSGLAKWPGPPNRQGRVTNEDQKKPFLDEICNSAKSPMLKNILDGLHERQAATVQLLAGAGWTVLRIRAKQNSPITSGLGEEHPLENGFMFHPLYGVPYLPASGVKGAVRSALLWVFVAARDQALDYDNLKLDEKAFMSALFGSPDKSPHTEMHKGGLTFFDAFPHSSSLRVDVANPHFPEYYRGKKDPTDDQNPNPIFFLTVPEETQWTFYILARSLQRSSPQQDPSKIDPAKELANESSSLQTAISVALKECGLGAKKSVGYGAFSIENMEVMQVTQSTSASSATLNQASIFGNCENLLLRVNMLTEKDKGSIDGLLEKANKCDPEDVIIVLKKLKEKVASWRDQKLNQKIDSRLTKLGGDGQT